MKRIKFCLLYCFLYCAPCLVAQPLKAKIKIDIERTTGEIDSMIYGNFTEHLGRCIYGGIYEPGSKEADEFGFRKDVLEATKDLHVSQVRWPGGNFVSGYHWMDGIGPKDKRPRKKDLAWGDIETNQVGTDEFLQWAKEANVQPYVCVNMGTGTIEEARNWVEYCNAPAGFYYSDLRGTNGHPQPYNVKIWGLGNEMDGPWQMGHLNAEDYTKKALEAAKLMKWSDNKIRLIASGSSNYGADWQNWNSTVLNVLFDYVDYISLHHYAGNRDKDHYKFMASTQMVNNVIDITRGLIKEVQQKHKSHKPVYIAFDEYNVWYRAGGEQKLEEHYNMQDVLVVASYLNTFIRNADVVKIANMAQLVNVIAPMMVTNDMLWKQTIYYPLQLFSKFCYGQSIDAFVESDTYDAGDYKSVPYLDVSTVYNKSTGELIISAVNRHLDKSIETSVVNQFGKFAGKATVYDVNAEKITDENTVRDQNVKTKQKEITVKENGFVYSFPPHSFTMIKVKLNN